MLATEERIALRRLLGRLAAARQQSDATFDVVRADSIYERPIPERHRIIFYLGHLEAFDWNLLYERVFGLKSFHPDFDRLFAFGIDPLDGGVPSDQPSDWPSVEEVRRYVSRVRAALDEKLAHESEESCIPADDAFPLDTLLNVAIEHRLMHIETLAYMLHQLPFERKVLQPDASPLENEPVYHRMLEVPSGVTTLGLSRETDNFGWDNEYTAHTVAVPAFEIDMHKVTNRQYLEFMDAGGYDTRAVWSDEDWSWKNAHGISHPVFWTKADDRWFYRAMFQEIPLPLDWPVYVSHVEAIAYARWAGKALPTEEEWQRAAYGSTKGSERYYPWGSEAPNPRLGNFDFQRWDPAPVNAFPLGQSAFGVQGMLGNGWEWTSSVFAPFPGFEPFPFYPGYSADFFDGKHFVMKGGSARTAACMLRPTFRNWFQTHYQYAYAGFRCVSR
jgi:gamma-glutamyl hercynylcysteine S-oxide synthase